MVHGGIAVGKARTRPWVIPACLVLITGLGTLSLAADEGLFIIELRTKPGETQSYKMLISETLYTNGNRISTLYREDMKIENQQGETGKIRQAVMCTGSSTVEGERVKQLPPFKFYLSIGKTGEVLEVIGLRQWDSRLMETMWLRQILLPDRPVKIDESWAVEEEVFGGPGTKSVLEKRTYTFVGPEKIHGLDSLAVEFMISSRGRKSEGPFTYIAKGKFYVHDGKIIKFESSEVVYIIGKSKDMKAFTMVQVELQT